MIRRNVVIDIFNLMSMESSQGLPIHGTALRLGIASSTSLPPYPSDLFIERCETFILYIFDNVGLCVERCVRENKKSRVESIAQSTVLQT
jgi:hypothetical protein